MALLGLFPDENFLLEVERVIDVKDQSQARSQSRSFGRNVIDPFAALFEMSGFVRAQPLERQRDGAAVTKTLQNHVFISITDAW